MPATKRNRSKPSDALYRKTREKIQTTQLVNRLQDNGLGKKGVDLTQGQIASIKILLDKSLPSLQSTELTGDPDKPVSTKNTLDINFVTPKKNG